MACTVINVSCLRLRDVQDEDSLHSGDCDRLTCKMDPADTNSAAGLTHPVEASPVQKQTMQAMLQSGELVSGHSALHLAPENVRRKLRSSHQTKRLALAWRRVKHKDSVIIWQSLAMNLFWL
jgi:hypothetical protein